jgi:hypothetical protein
MKLILNYSHRTPNKWSADSSDFAGAQGSGASRFDSTKKDDSGGRA